MTQFVDFVALGWVEQNLREEMAAARGCLQRFQREPGTAEHLAQARRYMHTATGALRLCALEPAAVLSSEIEQVLAQLQDAGLQADQRRDALTELFAAIEALPAYLASVRSKREVTPGNIAAVVNDLRRLGDRPPLPASLFFNPPLPDGVGVSANAPRMPDQELRARSKEALRICQRCSGPALKGDRAAMEQLRTMGGMASCMLAGTPLEPYFRLHAAFIEALATGGARPDEVVVDLFRHCFNTLRDLAARGHETLADRDITPQLKRMLFYIGRQEQPSAEARALLDAYGIDSVERYSALSTERMIQEDDLLDALQQTLQQLLEVIHFLSDTSVELSSANTELSGRVLPRLQQVGLQLHVVGLTEQAAVINEQYKVLRDLSRNVEPARQSDLLEFGAALSAVRDVIEFKLKHGLAVEGDAASLDLEAAVTEQVNRCLRNMKAGINRHLARRELALLVDSGEDRLEQSIAGLRPLFRAARALGEEDLIEAADLWVEKGFPSPRTLVAIATKLLRQFGDADYIDGARRELDEVLSVLGLLEERQRESQVLVRCTDYLDRAMELGGLANDRSMESFATAVAALEQYMDSRLADPRGSSEQHLLRAEKISAELARQLNARSRVEPGESRVLAFTREARSATGNTTPGSAGGQAALEPLPDRQADGPESQQVDTGSPRECALAVDLPRSGTVNWRDAMAAWNGRAIEREPDTTPDNPEAEIDQELRECFVEECDDYFGRLETALESLALDPCDRTPILEVRVVFHTMKGSARTIGLAAFGDFMHDMEIVFNGLRDGYLQSSSELVEFVNRVAARLPDFADLIGRQVPLFAEDFDVPHAIAEALADKRFNPEFQLTIAEPTPAAEEPAAEDESGEDLQELVFVPYSPQAWESLAADELLASACFELEAAAAGRNRAALEQAGALLRAAVPALLELRDARVLEVSADNLACLLGLEALEGVAGGSIYGLVSCEDQGLHKVTLSAASAERLYAYLDEIEDSEALVAVHTAAISLLSEVLSLAEAAAPRATAPDNVVVLRKPGLEQGAGHEDIDHELLELFIETLDEYTEAVDAAVLALGNGERGAIRSLKNTLHTVKGAANSVGLRALGTLVHDFETVLGDLELGDAPQSVVRETAEGVLARFSEATDHVRRHKLDWDPDAVPEAAGEAAADSDPDASGEEADQVSGTLRVETAKVDRLLDMGLEVSMNNVRCRQALDAAGQDRAEVQSLARRVLALVDQLSLQLDTEIQAKTEALSEGEQFDPLEMDRMTEKQGLAAILREAAYDLQEESRELGRHIDDALRETLGSSRLLQTNQSELRQLRLVNFSRLGPGLRSLAHQVSHQLGKQIDFEFDCGVGGLDIRAFEQIRVALEHMLRNAIDHGISTPELRAAEGKAERGRIKLSISRSGSEFHIRMLDDGRGMDPEALVARGVELGLVGPDEAPTESEALRLVFHPGFSTASRVTDVSGRGVGMDAVYQSISQAGGSVEIRSKLGFYTQFDIRVPASIMVNEALLATVGEEQVAIPLTSLVGSEFQRREDVHARASDPEGRISFRGESYEVRYLGAVRGTRPQPQLDEMPDFVPVLFARHNRRRVAFFADGLDTAEDLVIRSLGVQYTRVPGVAGGAVKSDGQPVLALDLNEFILQVDHADQRADSAGTTRESAAVILCVDDSVMMRRTYEKRLASLGYEVLTAVDGADALDYLSQASRLPDFIFSDLEMPNMNGFDFIANLRRAPRLAHIPTVVVSSRDGEKHRMEAQRVGANGFMAKGSNSAEAMHALIEQHLHPAQAG